ncbi:methionyl-tRNA formyltransferase [Paradesulfitobacterium ferrireducens]|uniref:methionyl-tRNA formyltransferase n=1 Tax=Paradesulfitobacterium ferrireducens TaxID=2816476 RepID=UPI001A8E6F47|nr:methionyl-tRNA formyltransferase [Paradesulfitobacterium ferrireducens]
MRVVFMGTPDFAVPSLQALVEGGHEVAAVFTQPDRPAGRGKQLKQSPVKVFATEAGLKVFQPPKIKDPLTVAELSELIPDCIVVVAYGQILSRAILEIPPFGCVNVHASLLPHYRGAAPIHWAVMNGESVTGVTTMLMDEGLDTGDILLQREYAIEPDETTGEVHDALAEMGGTLLLATLDGLAKHAISPRPQDGEYSYAVLLTRDHEQIQWGRSARELHNQIRGLNPWPGAYTHFQGEGLKIWRSRVMPNLKMKNASIAVQREAPSQPGQTVGIEPDGILVQTGEGILKLLEVQPAGKRPMPARDFFNGRRATIGEAFS